MICCLSESGGGGGGGEGGSVGFPLAICCEIAYLPSAERLKVLLENKQLKEPLTLPTPHFF